MSGAPVRRGSIASSFRIKEGWLVKRGHVFTTWRKRFFVLDGQALAYHDKIGSAPKGVIDLRNATVFFDAAAPPQKSGSDLGFPFTVASRSSADPSASTTVYLVLAPTEADRAAWVEAIQFNIRFSSATTTTAGSSGSGGSAFDAVDSAVAAAMEGAGSLAASTGGGGTATPGRSLRRLPVGAVDASGDGSASSRGAGSMPVPGALGGGGGSGDLAPLGTPLSPARGASNGSVTGATGEGHAGSSATASLAAVSGWVTGGACIQRQTSGAAPPPPPPGPSLPSCVRIFTVSWNMGEAPPPAGMCEKLLPSGCDIYAISLQECMHTEAVLAAVSAHLGGGYLLVDHRIGATMKGLGFHGHIALAVYVADWLVASGLVRFSRASRASVALGVNLVVTRAANKGAAAISLPLRLPDADGSLTVSSSLVFVSCHLASDNKGNSKLTARIRDARQVLEDLSLTISPAAVARAAQTVQSAGITLPHGRSRQQPAASASASGLSVSTAAGGGICAVGCLGYPAEVAAAGTAAVPAAGPPFTGSAAPSPLAATARELSGGSGGIMMGSREARTQFIRTGSKENVLTPDASGSAPGAGASGSSATGAPASARQGALATLKATGGGTGGGVGVSTYAIGIMPSTRVMPVAPPPPGRRDSAGDAGSAGSSCSSSDGPDVSGFAAAAGGSRAASPALGETGSSGASGSDGAAATGIAAGVAGVGGGLRTGKPPPPSARPPSGRPRPPPNPPPPSQLQLPVAGRARSSSSSPSPSSTSSSASSPAAVVAAAPASAGVTTAGVTAVAPPIGAAAGPTSPHLAPLIATGKGRAASVASFSELSTRSLGSGTGSFSASSAGGGGGGGGGGASTPSTASAAAVGRPSTFASGVVSNDNPLGISASRSYVFVLGDLNFRTQMPFESAVKTIAAAGAATADRIAASGSLVGPSATGDPYVDADTAEAVWRPILQRDQLRLLLSIGSVFAGFCEPPITFPPTYRLRRAPTPNQPLLLRSRGDVAALDRVREVYTVFKDETSAETPGGVDSDASAAPTTPAATGGGASTPGATAAEAPSKVRTPSYCDRIIVRMPLLAGIPVATADYRQELRRRKSRRVSKGKLPNLAEFVMLQHQQLVGAGDPSGGGLRSGSTDEIPSWSSPTRPVASSFSSVGSTGTAVSGYPAHGAGTGRRSTMASRGMSFLGSDPDIAAAFDWPATAGGVAAGGTAVDAAAGGAGGAPGVATSGEAADPTSRFVPLPPLRCISYDAADTLLGSDHLPVVGVWELPLQLQSGLLMLAEEEAAANGADAAAARAAILSALGLAPAMAGPGVEAEAMASSTAAVVAAALANPLSGSLRTFAPFPLELPSALEVLMQMPNSVPPAPEEAEAAVAAVGAGEGSGAAGGIEGEEALLLHASAAGVSSVLSPIPVTAAGTSGGGTQRLGTGTKAKANLTGLLPAMPASAATPGAVAAGGAGAAPSAASAEAAAPVAGTGRGGAVAPAAAAPRAGRSSLVTTSLPSLAAADAAGDAALLAAASRQQQAASEVRALANSLVNTGGAINYRVAPLLPATAHHRTLSGMPARPPRPQLAPPPEDIARALTIIAQLARMQVAQAGPAPAPGALRTGSSGSVSSGSGPTTVVITRSTLGAIDEEQVPWAAAEYIRQQMRAQARSRRRSRLPQAQSSPAGAGTATGDDALAGTVAVVSPTAISLPKHLQWAQQKQPSLPLPPDLPRVEPPPPAVPPPPPSSWPTHLLPKPAPKQRALSVTQQHLHSDDSERAGGVRRVSVAAMVAATQQKVASQQQPGSNSSGTTTGRVPARFVMPVKPAAPSATPGAVVSSPPPPPVVTSPVPSASGAGAFGSPGVRSPPIMAAIVEAGEVVTAEVVVEASFAPEVPVATAGTVKQLAARWQTGSVAR